MLVKVAGKDTQNVINALIMNARKLPQELYKSLTWDPGKEMADHKPTKHLRNDFMNVVHRPVESTVESRR